MISREKGGERTAPRYTITEMDGGNMENKGGKSEENGGRQECKIYGNKGNDKVHAAETWTRIKDNGICGNGKKGEEDTRTGVGRVG